MSGRQHRRQHGAGGQDAAEVVDVELAAQRGVVELEEVAGLGAAVARDQDVDGLERSDRSGQGRGVGDVAGHGLDRIAEGDLGSGELVGAAAEHRHAGPAGQQQAGHLQPDPLGARR